jgi:hypothetical protein
MTQQTKIIPNGQFRDDVDEESRPAVLLYFGLSCTDAPSSFSAFVASLSVAGFVTEGDA